MQKSYQKSKAQLVVHYLRHILLGATLLLLSPQHIASQPSDTDGDHLSDIEEQWLATHFVPPKLWLTGGEGCGPAQFSNDWCLNGVPNSSHLPGYMTYDVVPLEFADLYNIEFTHFMDYDCGKWGFGVHLFDNEGFSVLVQKNGDTYNIISVQTFAHDNTDSDVTDRFYQHELPSKFYNDGLYISENKHSFYAHHDFCETQLPGNVEDCNNVNLLTRRTSYNSGSQFYYYLQPLNYNTSGCSACSPTNMACLLANSTSANCWSLLMSNVGKQYDGYPVCEGEYGTIPSLYASRKQQPPWIPPTLNLPNTIAHVDLYQREGFTCDIETSDEGARANYGSSIVYRRMPLRLICPPHWAYWEKYHSGLWQQDRLPSYHQGLLRSCFTYSAWTSGPSLNFHHNTRSFKLYGPSGATMTVYEWPNNSCGVGGVLPCYGITDSPVYTFRIPDGEHVLSVDDIADYIDFPIGFVSWALAPLADAGTDTVISDCSYFALDARPAARGGMDSATLANAFSRASDFTMLSGYTYRWLDETQGGVLIGEGPFLENPSLGIGPHRIRLDVRGPYVANHVFPATSSTRTASDWINVTVVRGQVVALPSRLDYGAIPPGGFRDRALSVTNNTDQNVPLIINPTVASSEYSIVEGAGIQSLGQGESAVIRVRYRPTGMGTHIAQVNVGNAYCGLVDLAGTCAPPFVNGSMYFDGQSGSIVAGNCGENLGISDAITVEAVVMPRYSSNKELLNEPFGVVVSKEDSTASGGSWSLQVLADGHVKFLVHQLIIDASITSNAVLAQDEYSHVAAVFDERGLWEPALIAIYINGALDVQQEVLWGALLSGEQPVVIGGYSYSSGGVRYRRMFNGIIDECRIWNRARTQAEIQATMSGALGPEYYGNASSGLVCYWPLDMLENLGVGGDGVDDARDMTASVCHGDIMGTVWPLNGAITAVPDEEMNERRFVLRQNYPNPFNPLTTIEYELPEASHVRLAIYSVRGELVCTILDEYQDTGAHVVAWDGRDSQSRRVPTGVYFYVIETGEHREAKRLMLIK